MRRALLTADRAHGRRLEAGGWSQRVPIFFSFLTPAPNLQPQAFLDLAAAPSPQPPALFRKVS